MLLVLLKCEIFECLSSLERLSHAISMAARGLTGGHLGLNV